ncbi:DUF445 domain-containing protein [Micropruina sonneratiae]|uniref:DUF445 domain-containing protein n=1 Tax=Micropruina sonneratiae TaxID=2986940 RepID=UPI002226730C|nr:DUF445 domain-containing protein [Micropruina sp. KQZ13P-5]MCW3158341.1 DUF445 domain-containing protein [Micropruina sp. KQZ13P-5]
MTVLPVELTGVDLERAARLRRMKLLALSLLLLAAVVYLLTLRPAEGVPWGVWGFVNAGAEAAMVGALADWFAVTALFRHPLGLPIPHTAIIPKRKNDIARNLQDFFTENFLTEEIIRERIGSLRAGTRLGQWLQVDANADRVVAEGARLGRVALAQVSDADVTHLVGEVIVPRLETEPLAGPIGDLLDAVVTDGAHRGLVDLVVGEVHDWLRRHPDTFNGIVGERAPKWAPGFVNRRVVRWTYDQAVEWLWAIRSDRDHPTRAALDDLLHQIARDLQHNPVVAERAERLKRRLLTHPQTVETIVGLWQTVRASLDDALTAEDSELRRRAHRAVQRFGRALLDDSELRTRLEGGLEDAAAFVVQTYGAELSTVISHTIERWDGRDAARKIELHVGRDLQFIRINGTVVGCLAGLAIHTVSLLVH